MVLLFAFFDISSLELLFIVSLAGFLAIIEGTEPTEVSLIWRTRVAWIAAAGIIGFTYIAVVSMIEILPSRYLPVHIVVWCDYSLS